MTTAEKYIENYYPLALSASKKYGIDPVVILAQGAHESAWGTSRIATQAKNFFGITTGGKPNEYWKGDAYNATTGLKFRVYANPVDSFMDFARLIKTGYSKAAAVSTNYEKYAEAISQSRYITELNGDNREVYKNSIIKFSSYISEYLKKKSIYSNGGGNGSGNPFGGDASLNRFIEAIKTGEKMRISFNTEIISENLAIEPEPGLFLIRLRNVGSDICTVASNIPLAPGDADIILGSDSPYTQLADKVTIRFEGLSSIKKVLVIKSIAS